MRLLVTGAGGFLGTWLRRQAIERGHIVGGLYHREDETTRDDFEIVTDITDLETAELIESYTPESVIHAAGMTSPDACEKAPDQAETINVKGTHVVAKGALDSGATFCYISTNFVFDGESPPYAESDHTNPINIYGMTKHEAELLADSYHPKVFIVRTSDLFGSGSEFWEWAVARLNAGDPVRLVDDVLMNPTYVKLVAEAILDIIDSDDPGIYHRSGPDCLSRAEFGRMVAEAIGADPGLVQPYGWHEFFTAPRPENTCLVTQQTDPVSVTDIPTKHALEGWIQESELAETA